MKRTVVGSLVGIVTAFMLICAVELFGAVVHPVPPGFTGTQEEMCEHVERFPAWVLVVVVPMWTGIALVSTWIAGRSGNFGGALFIGLLLSAILIFNISMLPYPIWFKIACVVAIPSAIASAVYASRRRVNASELIGEAT